MKGSDLTTWQRVSPNWVEALIRFGAGGSIDHPPEAQRVRVAFATRHQQPYRIRPDGVAAKGITSVQAELEDLDTTARWFSKQFNSKFTSKDRQIATAAVHSINRRATAMLQTAAFKQRVGHSGAQGTAYMAWVYRGTRTRYYPLRRMIPPEANPRHGLLVPYRILEPSVLSSHTFWVFVEDGATGPTQVELAARPNPIGRVR